MLINRRLVKKMPCVYVGGGGGELGKLEMAVVTKRRRYHHPQHHSEGR